MSDAISRAWLRQRQATVRWGIDENQLIPKAAAAYRRAQASALVPEVDSGICRTRPATKMGLTASVVSSEWELQMESWSRFGARSLTLIWSASRQDRRAGCVRGVRVSAGERTGCRRRLCRDSYARVGAA